jgi:hypothetical protein
MSDDNSDLINSVENEHEGDYDHPSDKESISSDLKVEGEGSNPHSSFKSFNYTKSQPRFAISHKLRKGVY